MRCSILTIALIAFPGLAFGQDVEIVVTGARIGSGGGIVRAGFEVPTVTLARRADFVLQNLMIECDTREAGPRISELRATIKSLMSAAARNTAIELSVRTRAGGDSNEELVLPLTDRNYDANITAARGRDQVSEARIVVKTPVRTGEPDEKAALDRIDDFVESIKPTGRSILDLDNDFALSIVNPGQYRGEIFKLIDKDAKLTSAAFGSGYTFALSRMERQVYWTRTGPVDLSLFIPYEMTISAAK